VAVAVTILAVTIFFVGILLLFNMIHGKKAVRYAVTLKHNEGAFVALCTKKRWDRWTFEDVKIVPTNPGAPVVAAAPGSLHVPHRNILYYQEIQETANATE
jgi:hypothetical protein